MSASATKQGSSAKRRLVAVIASDADLQRARRLRHLPDYFELRLDALDGAIEQTLTAAAGLRAPLIISARHPAEGGLNQLSVAARRRLLLRSLPAAAFVDVELRSVRQLAAVLDSARDLHVGRILSVHDLRGTPEPRALKQMARVATQNDAEVFKIVTRTDDAEQQARLVAFFLMMKPRIAISVMSVGRYARELRLFFARHGSALSYTHLGTPRFEGQWSFAELRRALRNGA